MAISLAPAAVAICTVIGFLIASYFDKFPSRDTTQNQHSNRSADMTLKLANLLIVTGVICFIATPFVPYWFLGISGAILIAGGVVSRSIIEQDRRDS